MDIIRVVFKTFDAGLLTVHMLLEVYGCYTNAGLLPAIQVDFGKRAIKD